MMSDFGNKINDFFKYKFEEIFSIIAILGCGASLVCFVIDLVFGTEWAGYVLVGFFFLLLASILVVLIGGIITYYIYELFLGWWLEDWLKWRKKIRETKKLGDARIAKLQEKLQS
ncbi:hypothetical protein LS68_008220 [Helicobacter sp. MIT 05-5293]|uniref:hypothetical protein n=1 Tax=Helicobacter sp. MIT 05-5293 TaxID=1548149 RepID=UPI0010FE25BF|nr:hypothetical protein [Helicobacter sp. MIT 05-5293]TLD80193.1 hypothetical protein LS68_008220 [Helicobacter sp. MIT 05-5293]